MERKCADVIGALRSTTCKAVFALLAVVGLAVVQRVVPTGVRQKRNDVAGFIYAVMDVVYAVLMALVVIAVWEDFAEARDTAEREASELADVFRLAHQVSQPEGRQLQELARMPRSSLMRSGP